MESYILLDLLQHRPIDGGRGPLQCDSGWFIVDGGSSYRVGSRESENAGEDDQDERHAGPAQHHRNLLGPKNLRLTEPLADRDLCLGHVKHQLDHGGDLCIGEGSSKNTHSISIDITTNGPSKTKEASSTKWNPKEILYDRSGGAYGCGPSRPGSIPAFGGFSRRDQYGQQGL